MLLENGHISEDGLKKIQQYADLIECRCPDQLAALLLKVREFESYSLTCMDKNPEDAQTHKWLRAQAKNLDAMLSSTIVQLARMEGFIDSSNEFIPRTNQG